MSHWTDDLPDKMVIASPKDAVRLIDEFPDFADSIYTGRDVPPGTAYVIDVAAVMAFPDDFKILEQWQ